MRALRQAHEGLRVLPIDANDLWREDLLDPAPKASNTSEAGEEQGRRR